MSVLKRAEIHGFEEFGRKFLLDVNRNSVYIIDDLILNLLDYCSQHREEEQIIEEMKKRYPVQSITDALNFLKYNKILRFEEEPVKITFQPFTNKFNIALNVAHSCNLKCKYCYIEKTSKESRRSLMSETVAKKAIDFIFSFKELEALGVSFYGGEPLLNYPVIKSTIQYASQKAKEHGLAEVEFHITTNGTLLNDDIISFLRDYNINVLISLDGPQGIHDAMRIFPDGSGTHRIVLNNLEKLLSTEGIHQVSASAVVTKEHRLKDVYKYLLKFDLRDIKISYVRYQEESELSLTKSAKQLYFADMRELAKDCLNNILGGKRPSYYDFETKILQLWKGSRKKHFCPAGIRRFGVSPDGDIYPCGVSAAQGKCVIGSVYDGLHPDKSHRFLQKISIENRKDCANCWARYLCAGGCFLLQGHHHSAENGCEINLKNTELAIAVFALVRDKNELLLSSIIDPEFLQSLRKLIPVPS